MTTRYDVAVVGAGPVGLACARLLGILGHRVAVVERWPDPYPLPRAVHFDHEIARLFQKMQLTEEVNEVSVGMRTPYEWRDRDGNVLLSLNWTQDGPSGWPTANFFSQPELERVLDKAVREMSTVDVHRGRSLVSFVDRGDDVELTLADGETLRARYLIGCDGANSTVRRLLGVPDHDLGFHYDWLILDVIPQDDAVWNPENWQLCDPARPTTIVCGGPGRRRWEFMRLPAETVAELDTDENAWRLLARWGRTPENTVLERHTVYTFQARWAESWNLGRVLLAGDAAHLMPPFAGQGMCSGIRDAANLAWKLDLVLRGAAPAGLLDTYTSERKEHLRHAISISVALGQVICVLDEDAAAERNRRMLGDPAAALPALPPERLGPGIVGPGELAGTLSPQFTAGGRRLDDVVGSGFTLLGWGRAPALTPDARRLAEQLGIALVGVTDPAAREFLAEPVLVRPDFYLYGSGEPSALVERLAADIGLPAPAVPR